MLNGSFFILNGIPWSRSCFELKMFIRLFVYVFKAFSRFAVWIDWSRVGLHSSAFQKLNRLKHGRLAFDLRIPEIEQAKANSPFIHHLSLFTQFRSLQFSNWTDLKQGRLALMISEHSRNWTCWKPIRPLSTFSLQLPNSAVLQFSNSAV